MEIVTTTETPDLKEEEIIPKEVVLEEEGGDELKGIIQM